jgi:hypothetical protein
VAASWTIRSKEDGPALYLAAACLSHLDQCAHAAARRAPGQTSQRRARGGDAGPDAAQRRRAISIKVNSVERRAEFIPLRLEGSLPAR